MIDIHAPRETVHTWRDFFIHIATIVVGLLIAIGLEQTVEFIHHSDQRHHLQEDLRGETARQHAALQNDLRTFAVERVWLLALRNDVDTMRSSGGKIKLSYRPEPTADPADPNHKPLTLIWPSDGIWQTAKSSGLIYLLPQRQGEIYAGIARQQDLFSDATNAWITEQTALIAFETQFDDGAPSSTPDLSRMSPTQLDQYYAMLTRNLAMRDTIVNRSKIFDIALTAVLDGVTSRAEILPRILKEHPDLER
jgi:hypothetical protein